MNSRSHEPVTFEPVSESALLVRMGSCIDPEINQRVHAFCAALRQAALRGIMEIVPAYASVLLRFDAAAWTVADGRLPHAALMQHLEPIAASLATTTDPTAAGTLHELPVCYGGACGEDLEAVANHCGLGVGEVIERHCAVEYRVAMLGFAPGFAYLLGLDPALATPRRAEPRTRVPAGSVAIGGLQTGIYPRVLPGGWQLLGRTPACLFDSQRSGRPNLLQAGDRVRFVPIDETALAACQEVRKRV